jgi:hypothetical protein
MSQRVEIRKAPAPSVESAPSVGEAAPAPQSTQSRTAVRHARMWAKIESPMRHLGSNPGAASWRPNAAVIAAAFPGAVSGHISVRSVSIAKGSSTYPVTLGVSIEGFENQVHTAKGHKFATVLMPGERFTAPETLMSFPDGDKKSRFFERFPGYSPQNLERGVLDPIDEPFRFVKVHCPLLLLLFPPLSFIA